MEWRGGDREPDHVSETFYFYYPHSYNGWGLYRIIPVHPSFRLFVQSKIWGIAQFIKTYTEVPVVIRLVENSGPVCLLSAQ